MDSPSSETRNPVTRYSQRTDECEACPAASPISRYSGRYRPVGAGSGLNHRLRKSPARSLPPTGGMTNTRLGSITGFIGWLIVTFVAAGFGAAASVNSPAFYQQLTRPNWAPPSWLFGPVWTALYLLMAIAAWMVWKERGGFAEARVPLFLFVVQLVLNGLWTWLFFAWRQGALAVVDIVILWILLVATIIGFRRVRPLAGALMIPYIAWVSFAAALSVAVWRLNPGLL